MCAGSARGRRSSSTVCCQQQKQLCSSSRQTWAVLLLWLSLCSMNKFAAAVCNAVTYNCPTALDAAKAMTNNNLQLPITNAAFSLACPTTGYTLITDMGCHQLASTMPSGMCCCQAGWCKQQKHSAQPRMYRSNKLPRICLSPAQGYAHT